MSVETEPPGAALTLSRYRDRGDGHLVESDAVSLAPGGKRMLQAGSYLVVATLPGHVTTRQPFNRDDAEA